jgi:hypothetical protein
VGLIELELKLSENTGVAATDFGETSNPAVKGSRSKRIPILRVRRFKYELKKSLFAALPYGQLRVSGHHDQLIDYLKAFTDTTIGLQAFFRF